MGDSSEDLELVQAINRGDIDAVAYLLKVKEVDPNKIAGYNYPIILAAHQGCKKVLKLLKKHNCCLTSRDMLDYNWYRQPIHIAAGKGHLDFVKKLIKYGVEVDAGDQENRTALHWACTEGKDDVCKYLISAGANVNAVQVDGITPLHAAVPCGRISTCRLLIENGADVCMADRDAWTPFHTVVSYKYLSLVDVLVKAGSDVHSLTVDNENALHITASNDCPEMLEYLLDLGINTEVTNNHGQTPFCMAVSYNVYQNGLMLVKAGTKFKGRSEFSPLKMAAERGYEDFIDLMLDHGYDCSGEKWIHERLFPPKISERTQICDKIIACACNPRQLKWLCIFYLRCLLQRHHQDVKLLDIPKTLKSYITNF